MSEFIEVKTADLIGPALDWAVMQAVHGDGPDWIVNAGVFGYLSLSQARVGMDGIDEQEVFHPYTPSTDWEHGGSLIETYRPDMQTGPGGMVGAYLNNNGGDVAPLVCCTGDTYLVALCRAIAFDKLGDTVQVPKELMP